MRIRRSACKTSRCRPMKKPGARRYRVAQHVKRLLAAGVSDEDIRHMNVRDIRQALKQAKA